MSTNVEQIKERLNIVDVISGYIKVEKAGINYKAKCPFHNEKTPSFFISPTRQSFYCFGCGEKGDIFSFVQKFESIDFKEALQNLADKAGVKLEKFKAENPTETDRENREKEKMFEIMEEATKVFEKQLEENKKDLGYLSNRGLSETSIHKWRLGFAKDEWRSLYDYLIGKGFDKKEMLQAGLIKKTEKEEKYYDTFRNRIMFPIFDASSKVIAFSGRAMKEDEKTPKYLNSPETKLFYKSEVLYGFNIAKNYIRKLDYTVLVEGQMDLVMSHQAGVLNTVASSGTALTELHLKKMQKLANRVILAYDSDEAGEKAGRRSAELALILGMEAKIASLSKGEDPASVVKADPEKWKKALRESEHFTDFALNKAIEENQGRNLTREIIKNVLPLVHLIQSDIEKTQFVKKIALKMKVREEDIWNDLRKTEKNKDIKTERLEKEENFRDEKEALIFEAEKYGLKIDIKKAKEEIEKRSELKKLKQELQKIAIMLDDKEISEDKEKELKIKFKEMQKKIKDLEF